MKLMKMPYYYIFTFFVAYSALLASAATHVLAPDIYDDPLAVLLANIVNCFSCTFMVGFAYPYIRVCGERK